MRKRASAVIIKDKKLLLVTGKEEDFYWTPGGKLDEGEDFESALKREVKEEMDCLVTSMMPYCQYRAEKEEIPNFTVPASEVRAFLVQTKGTIRPQAEVTKYIWATKEDLKNIRVTKGFRSNVVDRLIRENLL